MSENGRRIFAKNPRRAAAEREARPASAAGRRKRGDTGFGAKARKDRTRWITMLRDYDGHIVLIGRTIRYEQQVIVAVGAARRSVDLN